MDTSVLSIFKPLHGELSNEELKTHRPQPDISVDLRWYLQWLAQQIQHLPTGLTDLLRGADKSDSVDFSPGTLLYRIFIAVNQFARETPCPSIDEIVRHLKDELVLPP